MRLTPVVAALALAASLSAALAASPAQLASANPQLQGKESLKVSSRTLRQDAPIPDDYTSYGRNISPPLSWSRGPKGTRSYALILEDPDAPMATPFVHWVMWNIPANDTSLAAGKTPSAAVQGRMSIGRTGYVGPRPPPGSVHHYHFELFALDRTLDLGGDSDAKALEAAMAGHVLASGQIVATYQKK